VFSGRRWAIGHTRKATTGKVVEQNAHPFDMGDVVGAHNGMVFNHEELNYLYDRDYAVDSQHIFGHVADGIGTFADVEAYGAISFTSKEGPSGIYLGTFNEGELAVANVPEVGTFWSSDVRHLDMALSSMRFHKVRYYKLREGACYDVEPNGLWLNSMELDFASPWRTYSTALMKETGSVT
jgi:predicted glutamine amidotransferase